jgi:hypothetical protein
MIASPPNPQKKKKKNPCIEDSPKYQVIILVENTGMAFGWAQL